jgi:hypothetical protein
MHVGVERRLGFLVVLRRQAASLAISNEWADLPCPMGLLSDKRPRPKFIGWALLNFRWPRPNRIAIRSEIHFQWSDTHDFYDSHFFFIFLNE